MPICADVSLEELADKTELYSGADLENLCKEVILSQATNVCQQIYISMLEFEGKSNLSL